jgi:hypothetical protein
VAHGAAEVALSPLVGAGHGAVPRLMVGVLACSQCQRVYRIRGLIAKRGCTVPAEAGRRGTLVGLMADLIALVACARTGRHRTLGNSVSGLVCVRGWVVAQYQSRVGALTHLQAARAG